MAAHGFELEYEYEFEYSNSYSYSYSYSYARFCGTDVNRFLKSHAETTLRSMEMADALICLHDLIGEALPARLRRKLHVVYQSALPLPGPRRPSRRNFDICVIGHLRDVKDPFRAALAARRLPPESRLRVIHLGKAQTPDFANRAGAEMDMNPRYG